MSAQTAIAKPTPSEDYKDLEERLRDGIDQLRVRSAQSALIRAELNNQTDLQFSLSTGLKRRTTAKKKRVKPRSWKLSSHYRWWMRKMFKTKPTLTAYAGGKEAVDSERAQVVEAIFDHWRTNNGWLEAEKEVARWMYACGRGYCEPVWSQIPTFHKRVTRRKMLPTPTKNGKGLLSFVEESTVDAFGGDLQFRVHNPDATFLFPLSAKRWEEVHTIVTADIVTRDYIERFLGRPVAERELLPVETHEINQELVDNVARFTGSYTDHTVRKDPRYLIITSRERPSFAYPAGRLRVVGGGMTLADEPLPYLQEVREIDPTDALNLTMGIVPWFGERVAGTLLPPSRARILRHQEEVIDALLEDIDINRRQFGQNRFIGPKSELQNNKITEEKGQVITYEGPGNSDITVLKAEPLVGAMTEKAAAEDTFDRIAGRPQVLQGSNDTQVRSAVHFDILREEAEEDLALDVTTREQFAEKVGRLALSIARRRYDVERVTLIYGEEKAGYASAFMATNIPYDLRIAEGSAMPRNYASREAKILDLWLAQAIVRPDGQPDPIAFWTMLDLGVVNPTASDTMKARQSAENDFRRMLYEGTPVTPQPHENHPLHLATYGALMEEERFKRAPDERKALVFAHLQLRTAMFGQLQAAQIGPASPPVIGAEPQAQATQPQEPLPGAAPSLAS
jgi:hypothetical protein